MFKQGQTTRLTGYIMNNGVDETWFERQVDNACGLLDSLHQGFILHRADQELLCRERRCKFRIGRKLMVEVGAESHNDNTTTRGRRTGVEQIGKKLRSV